MLVSSHLTFKQSYQVISPFTCAEIRTPELGVDQLAQDVTGDMLRSQYGTKDSDSKPWALPNAAWKKRSQGLLIHKKLANNYSKVVAVRQWLHENLLQSFLKRLLLTPMLGKLTR